MKKLFIYFILIVLYTSPFYGQTVDGQFITNISPPTYSVTIAVNMQSGTGSAGVVSIEFTYNTDNLSFPSTPIKNTDFILLGDFNSYVTQNITRPSSSAVRISLTTLGTPSPVPLSTSPTNIITLYFTILDEQGSSNLTWVTRNIAPAFLQPFYTPGNWPNVNDSPLPIELISFTSKFLNGKIQLNWETKTEVNNYGFYVEKSINEGEWSSIGFVQGNGNSNSPKDYGYVDDNIFAGGRRFQYRLKQVDNDGSFEYSDAVEIEVVPNEYELSQNFPNPFNPSTTIRFSLPQATQLKMNVYNIIGEQVATIAEGMYEAGYHKVSFNASNLPSGAYIYRIESSNFVQVKKMILIK